MRKHVHRFFSHNKGQKKLVLSVLNTTSRKSVGAVRWGSIYSFHFCESFVHICTVCVTAISPALISKASAVSGYFDTKFITHFHCLPSIL
jgi:hypothetical protein